MEPKEALAQAAIALLKSIGPDVHFEGVVVYGTGKNGHAVIVPVGDTPYFHRGRPNALPVKELPGQAGQSLATRILVQLCEATRPVRAKPLARLCGTRNNSYFRKTIAELVRLDEVVLLPGEGYWLASEPIPYGLCQPDNAAPSPPAADGPPPSLTGDDPGLSGDSAA